MRTTFIIDGFNLYHSVRQASRDLGLGGAGTKWLDLPQLCSSYLHLLGKTARLEHVYYFSALATHLEFVKPDVTARHRTYIQCLEDAGVSVELSRFKAKDITCPACGKVFRRHEEKETDVAVAAKLLELFSQDECDAAILMTGDTDIAPAVRAAQRLFVMKRVCFAFPYARKNRELAQLAPTSFQISKTAYAKHQLPSPYILKNGSPVAKPSSW